MARLNYKSYPFILHLARNLRNNQTSHEILVWNILRRKKLSRHKFLRQHPIFYSIRNDWVDFYIADFYCAKLKLIIEVDGKIHESQKEYDLERDSKLLKKIELEFEFCKKGWRELLKRLLKVRTGTEIRSKLFHIC